MLSLSMTAVRVTMDLVSLAKKRGQAALAGELAFVEVQVTPTVTGVRMTGSHLLEVDPETFAEKTPAEIALLALDGKYKAARACRRAKVR